MGFKMNFGKLGMAGSEQIVELIVILLAGCVTGVVRYNNIRKQQRETMETHKMGEDSQKLAVDLKRCIGCGCVSGHANMTPSSWDAGRMTTSTSPIKPICSGQAVAQATKDKQVKADLVLNGRFIK